jgi:hypothetical protein
MTETTSSAITEITRKYLAVWSEPDPAVRRAAVAGLWAPDGVEFIDGIQFRGHDELDARVTRLRRVHRQRQVHADGRK